MDLLASMAETEQKASSDNSTKNSAGASGGDPPSMLGKRNASSVSAGNGGQGEDNADTGSPAGAQQRSHGISEAEATAIETLKGGLRQPSASKSAKKNAADHIDTREAKRRARQLDFGGGSEPSAANATKIKGDGEEVGENKQLSPSSAAGTLLGFAGGWFGEGPATPSKRKSCNCKHSKCLKLYCECFAGGSYCTATCNCQLCHNNEMYEAQRKSAIDATLERNPMAFRPKIATALQPGVEDSPSQGGRHTKGCHCKKSGCLKKYCECFQAGVLCSVQCKCYDCRNTEESAERKALMVGTAAIEASGTPSPTAPLVAGAHRALAPNAAHLAQAAEVQAVHSLAASALAAAGHVGGPMGALLAQGVGAAVGGRAEDRMVQYQQHLRQQLMELQQLKQLQLLGTAQPGGASAHAPGAGDAGELAAAVGGQRRDGGAGAGALGALGALGELPLAQLEHAILAVRHAQRAQQPHLATALLGLPFVGEGRLAERHLLRKHLADPVLHNLARVLLLAAKNAGGAGGAGGAGAADAGAGGAADAAVRAAVLGELRDHLAQIARVTARPMGREGAGAGGGAGPSPAKDAGGKGK